ncbi:MAG: AraC family transcriptional regulator [Saonia sp.]
MKGEIPIDFEYQQYLREVLLESEPKSSLYIATEKDFSMNNGIEFPYRSNFYAFGILHQSKCELQVGINTYELKKKSLTLVGPRIVRNWTLNNWDMENTTVFFKESLFQKPFYRNFLLDYDFFKVGAKHVVNLSNEEYTILNSLIKTLQEFKNNANVSSGLLFSILEYINVIYSSTGVNHSLSRYEEISQNFCELLYKNYRSQKNVKFYSENLNLTSKHLSEVLKKTIGKTIKQSIEEMTILESQSLLKQTAMDIKEIMYWLGYEDPSYFTKFFKNKVGLTPSEYRSKV